MLLQSTIKIFNKIVDIKKTLFPIRDEINLYNIIKN